MSDTLLISGFQVQVLSGSPLAPAGDPAGAVSLNGRTMPASIVTWTFAPDWLTPGQAAQLLGWRDEAGILELIEDAAIVAEEDGAGGWLVEKRGLREFYEALWEVLTDEQ